MAHKKLRMAKRLRDDSFEPPAKRERPNISDDFDAELENELREFEKLQSSLLGSNTENQGDMEVDSNQEGDTVGALTENQVQEQKAGKVDKDVASLDTACAPEDSYNMNNTSTKGLKQILRQSLVSKEAKQQRPKKSLANGNCGALAAERPSPKKGKCVVTQMSNHKPVPPVMAPSEVNSPEKPRMIATLLPRKVPALQGGVTGESEPVSKITLEDLVAKIPMLDPAEWQEPIGVLLVPTEPGNFKSPHQLMRPNCQRPDKPETLPVSASQGTSGIQLILTEQGSLKSRKLTRPNCPSPSSLGELETLPVPARQNTDGIHIIRTEQGSLKSPLRPTRPNSLSSSIPGQPETLLVVGRRQETREIQFIPTEQGLKSPHRPTRPNSLSPSMPEKLPVSAGQQETTGIQLIPTDQGNLKSPRRPTRPNSQSLLIPSEPERIIDITTDTPIEYCMVERALRWRFKNGNGLDLLDDPQNLMEANRPGIWCPELHPHVKLYETDTWLAACNELKRFFCWRCLFFSSKPLWYITSDKGDDEITNEVTKHKKSADHEESVKLYLAWLKKKKVDVVNYLLANNFVDGTWSNQSRELLVLKSRPVSNNPSTKELFNQFPWICSCSLGIIRCWPCLLFTKQPWKLDDNVESARGTLQQHATTFDHLEACVKLGKWEFDLKSMSQAKTDHYRLIRAFIRHLVEVILAENKKIDNDKISAEGLIGSIESLSYNSKTLKPLMDGIMKNSKIPLDEIVKRHLTVTLNTIERSLKQTILDEIESNAVSLIFDHSSSVTHQAVLSVIARYVDSHGLIHERFIKLLNVGYNTHSYSILDEVLQIISELQCRATLVGFAYDGFLVKPEDIPEFNAKVEKFCSNAKFFHYREHNFKTVVTQSLSHDEVCRRVMWAVTDLGTFFQTTPKARKGLAKVSSPPSDDFWTSPDFIKSVYLYHSLIVDILKNIGANSNEWEANVVLQAINFFDFLHRSTNRLFITLIAHILEAFNDLAKAVDDDVGFEETKKIASSAILRIQKLGNFVNVVDSACSHLDPPNQEKIREKMMSHRDRFSNVIRMVIKLVKNRVFELDPGYFKVTQAPSTSLAIKLQNDVYLQNIALPTNFRSSELSRELQFFHNSSLTGSTLTEIVANLKNYNMIRALPELFKFLQLALAVPRKLYGESATPAVRRIAAYIEGKNEVNSQDALMWMEKKTLAELQEDDDFLDKATTHILTRTQKFIPGGKV